MSNPDRSRRILTFGIALAIVGLIFSFNYARAATFAERFAAVETPKQADPFPATSEQWGIKLLLLIDGKIARSVVYNEEIYPSSDACRSAVEANITLQASAQAAAKVAVENFGVTAAVGIACAMQFD